MTSPGRARPKDAAGIVLIRQASTGEPEILLGRRRAKAGFLPNIFVVPGGCVDASDRQPTDLQEIWDVGALAALADGGGAAAPAMFARCALRELWEETGLILGHATSARLGNPEREAWLAYRAQGLRPAFDSMTFVLRAITPTYSPRRYNTRFFLSDGSLAIGDLKGDGELEDLGWYARSKLADMGLVDVTTALIREALDRWSNQERSSAISYKLLSYKHNLMIVREKFQPLGIMSER